TREKDETNIALTEEWDDIQAKVDADYQLAQDCKLKNKSKTTEVDDDQEADEEEVAIDAIPLATKPPTIVD
ncbi:hypothetical protein Tco_1579031, partial [Tanacetum coccineum]